MEIKEKYQRLLKAWCDGMLDHQITGIKGRGIEGGLICPACSMIHGRCYGAAHPLLYMAKLTGENKYALAAEQLIFWSDHMECPDGSFVNDAASLWKGITAFSAAALMKSRYLYAELLSGKAIAELDRKIRRSLDFLADKLEPHQANINYLIGTAYALALGGKYTENQYYLDKARKYAEEMLQNTTESGLLRGEGKPWDLVTEKGCSAVDIGYNVEEAVSMMALYAHEMGDRDYLKRTAAIAKAHAAFLLPDGGWDNSFGSRLDKWTYWGSRTSDGCQPGYVILQQYEPDLALIAERNLEQLERCTYDGLLYGGRGLRHHGELPCIHHTFTHANGLAEALEWMEENIATPVREKNLPQPCKYYPELDTWLYSDNTWRATVTGYDFHDKANNHATGGALSLLYHLQAGPILAAGMTEYSRFELLNTQRILEDADTPLALRLQRKQDGVIFSNILDRKAIITHTAPNVFFVEGHITDDDGNPPPEAESKFTAEYKFSEGKTEITFTHTASALTLYIPALLEAGDVLEGLTIKKGKYVVKLTASQPVTVLPGRWFSHVPGFEAAPYLIENVAGSCTVTFSVEQI